MYVHTYCMCFMSRFLIFLTRIFSGITITLTDNDDTAAESSGAVLRLVSSKGGQLHRFDVEYFFQCSSCCS